MLVPLERVRDDLLGVARESKTQLFWPAFNTDFGDLMLEGDFNNAEEQFKRVIGPPGRDQATADRSALVFKSNCYGVSSWNAWLLGDPGRCAGQGQRSGCHLNFAGLAALISTVSGREQRASPAAAKPDLALQKAEAALKSASSKGCQGTSVSAISTSVGP